MDKKKDGTQLGDRRQGKAPESLAKGAGVFPSAPGESNTRCETTSSNPYDDKLNALIDWFKFSFNRKFNPSDEWWHPLLKVLKVDPFQYDVDRGGSGSKQSYWYDQEVAFFTGGERTKSNGQETTWLDMSGQACRDFEERGGDWRELITVILPMVERGNRVDVAIDDFSGVIDLEELQGKIWSHSYTTSLRRFISEGEFDPEGTGETDRPRLIFSKKGGFTATFGGKSTKQLCIYNKKAERAAKDYVVVPKTWVRYEARFFHEAAISVLQQLYGALTEETFPQAVSGLIGGLVEFKETPTKNNKNAFRIPTWTKWSELLNGVAGIKVQNQAKIELSLARKHEWLKTASGRTMGMVFLAEPTEFENVVGFIVASWLQKLDNRSLAAVNSLRRRYNKGALTMDEAIHELTKRFSKYEKLSPYLQSLFKEFDEETGEVDDPDKKE